MIYVVKDKNKLTNTSINFKFCTFKFKYILKYKNYYFDGFILENKLNKKSHKK